MALSSSTRLAAGILGVCTLASIPIQIYGHLVADPDARLFNIIWVLLRYFTILTNIAVGLFFSVSAWRGRLLSYSLLCGLVSWISVVGVAYHILLSGVHNPVGILAMTNIVHHTLVPSAVVLFWFLYRPASTLAIIEPVKWTLFPAAYGAYAITRGIIGGTFPYFYMDPGVVGWGGVVASQIQFFLLFLGLGLALRFVANKRFNGISA